MLIPLFLSLASILYENPPENEKILKYSYKRIQLKTKIIQLI